MDSTSRTERLKKKPLLEKRRRARINTYLEQLKKILLETCFTEETHCSKLEKADILEMTVNHIKLSQRQNLSAAVQSDPAVITRFHSGFMECLAEVRRYLTTVDGMDPHTKDRLLNHLYDQASRGIQPSPVSPTHSLTTVVGSSPASLLNQSDGLFRNTQSPLGRSLMDRCYYFLGNPSTDTRCEIPVTTRDAFIESTCDRSDRTPQVLSSLGTLRASFSCNVTDARTLLPRSEMPLGFNLNLNQNKAGVGNPLRNVTSRDNYDFSGSTAVRRATHSHEMVFTLGTDGQKAAKIPRSGVEPSRMIDDVTPLSAYVTQHGNIRRQYDRANNNTEDNKENVAGDHGAVWRPW